MDQVHELINKRRLDELVYGALRSADSCDWNGLRTKLDENATFDFTGHSDATDVEGIGALQNLDEFLANLQAVVPGFDSFQHYVTNMIHSVDGDTATTFCYVYAEHFLNNDLGDRDVTVGGAARSRRVGSMARGKSCNGHFAPRGTEETRRFIGLRWKLPPVRPRRSAKRR